MKLVPLNNVNMYIQNAREYVCIITVNWDVKHQIKRVIRQTDYVKSSAFRFAICLLVPSRVEHQSLAASTTGVVDVLLTCLR